MEEITLWLLMFQVIRHDKHKSLHIKKKQLYSNLKNFNRVNYQILNKYVACLKLIKYCKSNMLQ